MGTLHTNAPPDGRSAWSNQFPADKQTHVRTMLSTSLRGFVSQQLLPERTNSRAASRPRSSGEYAAVANLIRQGKLDQLENTMQSGAQSACARWTWPIQALLDDRVSPARSRSEGHQQVEVRAREDQG